MAKFDERRSVAVIRDLLRKVRDTDAEMPAQTLATLVEIAAKPDVTMNELQQILGVASATMTRIVARLSEYEKEGVPGLNFVVRREMPTDRRFKIVQLTNEGKIFIRSLTDVLSRHGVA